MKKKCLLTALLLPSLLFSSPSKAADIEALPGTSYENGNAPSVLVAPGQSAIIHDTVNFINNTVGGNKATVHNGGDLTIGAAIFEGNSSAFGAIHNFGTLTVDGATFNGNAGVGSFSYAGAIYGSAYTGSGAMDIKNATFTSNTNNNGWSGAGAVYFAGETPETVNYLSDSTFTDNHAHDSLYEYGTGGAVSLGYGKLYVDNVEFTKNTADIGGALYGFSRASDEVVSQDRFLTVTNSTFTENEATFGGAIGNSANFVLADSKFIDNSSTQKGGAIYNEVLYGNVTSVTNSTFEGNSSLSGGAIFTESDMQIGNAVFDGNSATEWAGAVYVTNGALTVENGTFTNNTAGWGGAIIAGTNNSNLVINNGTFENNSALAYGAVGVFKNAAFTNSKFIDNKATDANDDGGGAMFVGSEGAIAKLDNVTFRGNTSASSGGAIGTRVAENANGSKNDNSAAVLNITNSTFEGNTAETTGGAIDNHFYSAASGISNSTFTGNSAAQGGAIYNHGDTDNQGNAANLRMDSVTMTENSATGNGGAIYNEADMSINNLTATGNTSGGSGGVIYAKGLVADAVTKVTNSTFDGNSADSWGGVAFVTNSKFDVENSAFTGNTATYGGAIASGTTNSNLVIDNSSFENNTALAIGAVGVFKTATITNTSFVGNKATDAADDGAGALFLGAESQTIIENAVFENNYSASRGGAIATRDILQGNNVEGKLDISNTSFVNNEAVGDGGAIYNAFYNSQANPQNVSVVGVTFDGNKAGGNGGAIYNAAADLGGSVSSVYITDSSFTNNSSAGQGGAIYSHGTVNIEAKNADVTFANNTSGSGSNDIYMAAAGSELNIKAAEGRTVSLSSGIAGESYLLNINLNPVTFARLRASTPQNYTGSVVIGSAIQNATVNVASGELHLAEGSSLVDSTLTMGDGTTLNTINNAVDSFDSNVTLGDDVSLLVDVNLSNGTADNFSEANQQGAVVVDGINYLGNTTANSINMNLAQALGVDPSNLTITEALQQTQQTILTPVRYLTGSVSADGTMSFVPTGNSYRDFNSAIMAAPVAAQLGGYLNQLNSYDQAFMNMDMRMLMNSEERQALRRKNSYAAADTSTPMVYSPIFQPEKNKGGWVRAYSTFENVKLQGGPKVSNVMYGTYFGGDSDMYTLENGAEVQYSLYAGYNGSHQAFGGNSLWQNGGTLGATAAIYKDNFFSALTANVGANVVDGSTMYGKEDFPMLMSGIASKTGYNWELASGKFIVQPNYLMSYSFVNTFDYTNAAGVRVKSDPLHAIQIAPGVKFIGNLPKGWQPYVNLRMVWNIMDDTKFTAADASLPQLSVKPYFEYGVGVQKRWGERFTGFFQAMLRSGGRNGISLGMGFRWAIGKAPQKMKANATKTPTMPQPQVKLSNVK